MNRLSYREYRSSDSELVTRVASASATTISSVQQEHLPSSVPLTNVLLFIDDLSNPLAGTEQHLLFLLAQLPRPPLRVTFAVFSGFDARASCLCSMEPVLLSRDASRGPWGTLQKIRRLATLISQEQIDVVHTFCPMSELLAIIATRLAKRGRVLGVRRNTGDWHSRWTLWRTRLARRFHVDLAANCEAARHFSIETEWARADRISVIRNPVFLQRRKDGLERAVTREALGIGKTQPVVGIVANVRPVKDFETFLNAARLVVQSHPEARFLVVGAGEPEYLARMKELARALKLQHQTTWLGAVENPFSILPLFDVGVLSSRSEGFSNTLLEYAAAAVPAVATDVGGTREIVDDGETGFVVPPNAPVPMAARICEVLGSSELRRRLGEHARQRAEDTFSERQVILQYRDLYAKIVEGAALRTRARATTLVFHGILGDHDTQTAMPIDDAAARYALDPPQFRSILAQVNPDACCTVSSLITKPDGDWTVLTFDDGLSSDFTRALPELQERQLRATFFVTSNNIGHGGYLSVSQLRELAQAGMDIASHGLTHRYLVSMKRADAAMEIRDSKARLEDILGCAITAYAPVGGHYSKWMVDAAAEAGYRVFATMIPGQSQVGGQIVLLRRNHLQAHHSSTQVTKLLAGDPRIFRANRLRYGLLRIPKSIFGMATYDRLKGLVLRTAKNVIHNSNSTKLDRRDTA